MDNYGILIGLVVLLIFVFVIVMELRKSSDKKAAINFLQDLGDEILDVILRTISETSPKDFKSLEDFNNHLVEKIYNQVWNFITVKASSDDVIDKVTKAVFTYVDGDTLVKFINDIMEQNGITDKIANDFAAYSIKEYSDSIVEEDKKLEEEYSDEDQYVETSNDDELAPAEDKDHTEEEIAAINPQREEEEDFNAEDDSMEIVTDKKEIITAKSKTGQDLYYEVDVDGKKKRVSKEYALKYMNAQV